MSPHLLGINLFNNNGSLSATGAVMDVIIKEWKFLIEPLLFWESNKSNVLYCAFLTFNVVVNTVYGII